MNSGVHGSQQGLEMKDIQGIDRGACSNCECKEYKASPPDKDSTTSGSQKLRCEYCNHTPAEHVCLVGLGYCSKCGRDNCSKFELEEGSNYGDCGYCGCEAKYHQRADDKLRRNPDVVKSYPSQSWTPRLDERGRPAQSIQQGMCKKPGCPFPKRIDQGKVHDFCSRTCASYFSKQNTAQTSGIGSTSIHGSSQGANTMKGSVASAQGMFNVTLCSKCQTYPPNKGYAWCAACYNSKDAWKKE